MLTVKLFLFLGTVLQTPLVEVPSWVTEGPTVVYRNPGTVRARNWWNRLNLQPGGVEPTIVAKSL